MKKYVSIELRLFRLFRGTACVHPEYPAPTISTYSNRRLQMHEGAPNLEKQQDSTESAADTNAIRTKNWYAAHLVSDLSIRIPTRTAACGKSVTCCWHYGQYPQIACLYRIIANLHTGTSVGASNFLPRLVHDFDRFPGHYYIARVSPCYCCPPCMPIASCMLIPKNSRLDCLNSPYRTMVCTNGQIDPAVSKCV